ncbi:MAG: putative sulfate exporter family transporter [Acidobacteriaceae bacterium]
MTMGQAATLREPGEQTLTMRLLRLMPGMAVLAGVGYAARLLEALMDRVAAAHGLRLPHGEYILWAIVLGMAISNTVGMPAVLRAGVATYEFWLKLGIVLLGAEFLIGDLLHLGGIALVLVAIEIVFSLAFMTMLGRGFGLRPKLVSLLAIGSAVCGVSAILATCGVIGADDEDTSYAIAAILALGVISLLLFPFVGHALHMSDRSYGLWAGLAVDNTAEATAAGALYSDAAGRVAVLTKTCRNSMLGFVVLGYAVYWGSRGQAKIVTNKARFLWNKFPKFVLGFLLLSALASAGLFNAGQRESLRNLSRWAFLLAFVGVGFRTNLRELKRQGARPFVVGTLGEVAIAVITLGLVWGAARML